MTHPALTTLTDKEKQTLRLIVRGHDAKSVAVTLGLSVHTINERLRDARRKLAVSSSREAARMLFEAEAATPEIWGTTETGTTPRPRHSMSWSRRSTARGGHVALPGF